MKKSKRKGQKEEEKERPRLGPTGGRPATNQERSPEGLESLRKGRRRRPLLARGLYPAGQASSTLKEFGATSSASGEEELLLGVSVSEVHGYPSGPEGFEEPLFPTVASKRTVMEHFLKAPWLIRASELKASTGEAAHALKEPVELDALGDGVELVRPGGRRRRFSWRKRRVVEVLDRWREVGGWWDEADHADRVVFRVLLAGGAVVDIARERSGGWLLVGVED